MITIGFSAHRIETLPSAFQEMIQHDIIILEEPPSHYFMPMVRGHLSVEDYMLETDLGFPEFEKRMCHLLRRLHERGKEILQVEPYLERLLEIHDRFSEGNTPEDVMNTPYLREVYMAEKHATSSLIAYYTAIARSAFHEVIDTVKAFAHTDALRITLRAQMRSSAIASLPISGKTVYIESGYIHYMLYRLLCQKIDHARKIRSVFLLSPVIKRLGGKRRNMSPGDLLTLHYAFHNQLADDTENLLAARNLVYIKLIQKQEILPGLSETPHTEDDIKVNHLVDLLSFQECHEVFEHIRLKKQSNAMKFVENYIMQKMPY